MRKKKFYIKDWSSFCSVHEVFIWMPLMQNFVDKSWSRSNTIQVHSSFPGARGCGSYYFSINRYKKAPKWGILKSISSSISRHTYKFCSPNGKHFHFDWNLGLINICQVVSPISVLAILNVLFKAVLLQTTLWSILCSTCRELRI